MLTGELMKKQGFGIEALIAGLAAFSPAVSANAAEEDEDLSLKCRILGGFSYLHAELSEQQRRIYYTNSDRTVHGYTETNDGFLNLGLRFGPSLSYRPGCIGAFAGVDGNISMPCPNKVQIDMDPGRPEGNYAIYELHMLPLSFTPFIGTEIEPLKGWLVRLSAGAPYQKFTLKKGLAHDNGPDFRSDTSIISEEKLGQGFGREILLYTGYRSGKYNSFGIEAGYERFDFGGREIKGFSFFLSATGTF